MHSSLSARFSHWKLFIQNCPNLNDTVARSESFTVGDSLFYLTPLSPTDLAPMKTHRQMRTCTGDS